MFIRLCLLHCFAYNFLKTLLDTFCSSLFAWWYNLYIVPLHPHLLKYKYFFLKKPLSLIDWKIKCVTKRKEVVICGSIICLHVTWILKKTMPLERFCNGSNLFLNCVNRATFMSIRLLLKIKSLWAKNKTSFLVWTRDSMLLINEGKGIFKIWWSQSIKN